MMKESNIKKEKTVTLIEELNSAMKEKYGIIRIQGDLKDEIKKEFNNAQNKYGISWVVLMALVFIPVFGHVVLAFLGLIGSSLTLIKNAKSMKYRIRSDFIQGDELSLVHKKIIEETRKKYKDQNELTALYIETVDDMVAMNVNVIHISQELLEQLFKAKKIKAKNTSIEKFTNYNLNYKVIQGNDPRLVRIH